MRLQLFHGCARRPQKYVNIMQFIYMVHMYAACRVQTRTDRDSTREWERKGDKWTVCDTGALNTTASNSYSYEKCHTKRTFTLSNWVGCSPICLPVCPMSFPFPPFPLSLCRQGAWVLWPCGWLSTWRTCVPADREVSTARACWCGGLARTLGRREECMGGRGLHYPTGDNMNYACSSAPD